MPNALFSGGNRPGRGRHDEFQHMASKTERGSRPPATRCWPAQCLGHNATLFSAFAYYIGPVTSEWQTTIGCPKIQVLTARVYSFKNRHIFEKGRKEA